MVPAQWNRCNALTSRILLLVLRKTSGYYFLGLCWEAHHLLTWQPILALYSKLKGGMGERSQRVMKALETRKTMHVSFTRVEYLVQFP